MIKGSKGNIDACLHAIRRISYTNSIYQEENHDNL